MKSSNSAAHPYDESGWMEIVRCALSSSRLRKNVNTFSFHSLRRTTFATQKTGSMHTTLAMKYAHQKVCIFHGGGGWNRTIYQVVMSRLL